MSSLFIEAESFENLGGWVVDQQSMETMGSSYIMAHGMGVPVADATTRIRLPKPGVWHAWVRTRDWTAVWKRGSSAGIFRLKLGDKSFGNVLGNNGEQWDWQYAGCVEARSEEQKLSICDLTGFNGRCDAIYLSDDIKDAPRNTEEFRREASDISVEDTDTFFDLIVCGGGIAGVCMALTAVYEGLNTALIQDRPILGGCNSSEIKVGLGGFLRSGPYPALGNSLQEIAPVFGAPGSFEKSVYEDDRKLNAFRTAERWSGGKYGVFLNEHIVAVEKENDTITSVTAKNIYTGKMKRYKGRLFADCTGDATLSRLGGAEVMYGREAQNEYNEQMAPDEADNMVMGMTITWNTTLCDEEVFFPDIDWGIEFNEENSYKVTFGDWEWEAGQFRNMALETEYIRDYSLMTIFCNWSFIKNRSKEKERFKNRRLNWVSPLGGKRESYRVKGEHVLTENDIEKHIPYPDATASLTWDIDIHYPDPKNTAMFDEPFRSCAIHRGIREHYPIPYRCLYSKDIKNLFLGGRVVSTTHIAFSCVRVMRTLGVLGEVCGLAAGICSRENCLPSDIYRTHFDKLKQLMERGVVIRTYHAYNPSAREHLAFPGCDLFRTGPEETALPLDDKEMMKRINAMGARYYTYPRFEGIENRAELTDEEKEICERFYTLLAGKKLEDLIY